MPTMHSLSQHMSRPPYRVSRLIVPHVSLLVTISQIPALADPKMRTRVCFYRVLSLRARACRSSGIPSASFPRAPRRRSKANPAESVLCRMIAFSVKPNHVPFDFLLLTPCLESASRNHKYATGATNPSCMRFLLSISFYLRVYIVAISHVCGATLRLSLFLSRVQTPRPHFRLPIGNCFAGSRNE